MKNGLKNRKIIKNENENENINKEKSTEIPHHLNTRLINI